MKKLLLLLTTLAVMAVYASTPPLIQINPTSLTLQDFSLGKDLN